MRASNVLIGTAKCITLVVRPLFLLWGWLTRNHQTLTGVSAVAAIATVVISLLTFSRSAEHFTKQLQEQKRATSVSVVNDFITSVGSELLAIDNISENENFQRLVVTRSELLIGILQNPDLTNLIIYFLGSNKLSNLFDANRNFEEKPFISLSNVSLAGAKIRDIALRTPDLYCADLSSAWFSNTVFDHPTFDYADLSNANLVNTEFSNGNFLWSNLNSLSIELTIGTNQSSDEEHLQIFSNAAIRHSDLRGMTITKVKSTHTDESPAPGVAEQEYLQVAKILSSAKSLYGSQIDLEVLKVLKAKYPDAFASIYSAEHKQGVPSSCSGWGVKQANLASSVDIDLEENDNCWSKNWLAKKEERCSGANETTKIGQ